MPWTLLEGQRLVVEDDHDHGQLVADGRLDVTDVIAEAAVTGDAHDLPIGLRELGAQRRREAHPSEPSARMK